jgi:hypothetical protein
VPFLSNDVRFGGYHFDTAPTSYRKDILCHELHRHPFMLRLGSMYLMKLAHGEAFSCPAGACWRNLFIVALMPWMKRYRVLETSAQEDYDELSIWVREPSTHHIAVELVGDSPACSPMDVGSVLDQAGKLVAALQDGAKKVIHTAASMVVDEWPGEEGTDVSYEKKTQ